MRDHIALKAQYGSGRAAAAAAGISESTFRKNLKRQLARQQSAPAESESEIHFPDLPSSELPVEEIVEYAKKNFAQRMASRDARRWMEIKVKSKLPIGVCFMGDPHIDNAGTNWPLLDKHIRILRDTPGMFAIGGNDLTDNWIGRLMRLYADQKMSKKQTWKVAAWLLKDSGVKWLCHVLGNHDGWGDGPYLFKANAGVVPVENWQARFQIVFPNDARVRVHMAHDFPGHSQWNHLHGAQKAALFFEEADIYACAHKHCWAMHQEENAHRGFTYWLLRSRGYKFIDSYADLHGFGSQRYGASITAIIDPGAVGPSRVRCFAELAEAAEFLTWKRERAE